MAAAGAAAGGGAKRTTTRVAAVAPTAVKRKSRKEFQNQNHNAYDKRFGQQDLICLVSDAAVAAFSFLSQNDLLLLPSQTLTLESLISSTILSLRRTLEPLSLQPPPPPPPPPPAQPEQCWFSRFLSAGGENLWFDAFRMSESSFTLLLRLLTPALDTAIPAVPSNFVLAAALYRLAHGASYKAIGQRFGLDTSEACRAFYTVCKAVNDKLGHLFELRSDLKRILVGFGWLSLPNCCGVLGFGRFGVDSELLGENGSLLVQALVDSEGRFLDVSAGWPSTLKPETILHQTKLYLGIEESRELLNGDCYELGDGNSIPQYIIGDSCFPLLPWLLTPYRRSKEEGCFSSIERVFDSAHGQAMGLVSTAFGRVRARWQLLSKQWKGESIEYMPFVVLTCCLLHNFLIKCSEPMLDEKVASLMEEEKELPIFDGEMNESGQSNRAALAKHLSRVRLRR
ncbi:hypothetical protein UlMin_002942 [Ulmus minor]